MPALDSLIGHGLAQSPYQEVMEDKASLMTCLESIMMELEAGTSARSLWEAAYSCLLEVR